MNKPKALYIHIPFCKHICGYCDFMKVKYNAELADVVLARINADLALLQGPFKTIYFGGGTPSSLSNKQLMTLKPNLMRLKALDCEMTMEVNPETLTQAKVETMVELGVNRVSVGVQAIQSHLLRYLERQHSYEDVLHVLNLLRQAGITNVSFDAMYGIENQTLADFEATLQAFVDAEVDHVSLYALTIEPNTKFARMNVQPVDNELEGQFYELASNFLQAHGYEHYEVSAFAKNKRYSAHNLAYWHYDDFIGVGPGAASKVGNVRTTNSGNLHHYLNQTHLISEQVVLDDEDLLFEHFMMGLRLSEGIDIKALSKKLKVDVFLKHKVALQKGIEKGWLVPEGDQLKTSTQGRLFLHDVLLLFMP
ncbi:MAG: radical SAM family heme chaperone HemW [Erysipelothrix sp.]|jgi:oxygen-independent coproporphyrinogen-3 oxidase|nr:radical SAM family heme chaperone HemW [Erysipelothrix sp.]